jgi:Xaa-Pro aminopeptidase
MRLAKLREALQQQEVDAILISQPENRRYLSGFTGSAGWLLISSDRALLATDFRYYQQSEQEAPEWELARIETKLADRLPGLLRELGVQRLGFESEHLVVDQFNCLSQATAQVQWLPLKQTVERLRANKDESEIEALRRSAALTDAAFAHLLESLHPGMTEQEAAWEIEVYMRTHGASKVAFDLIVAAGPRGAMPHAQPSERAIQTGEPIVIDIGCLLDGYCSDMTRTICLGQASTRYLEVWDIVLQAQERAEASMQAGMGGAEADRLARDLIAESGFGDYFGHGLGHGVGLAVHEAPRVGKLSEDTLSPGMSVTVEPGIYLPGEFGVRLEDLVIVRPDGVEVLTRTPKAPVWPD